MRIYYLSIATVFLLLTGCKKETKELQGDKERTDEEREAVSNISNPCYGDVWEYAGSYSPGTMVPLFVHNNKAYVIRDVNTVTNTERVEVFDGVTWQTIASVIPFWTNHPNTYAFNIGGKGFIGRSDHPNIFYEYNILTNTFTPKTGLPVKREGVATFVIGKKCYVVGGSYHENGEYHYSTDTWEYDPATDSWTKKADFSNMGYLGSSGFSIGNKGYIVNGYISVVYPNVHLNYLLEYDPAMDKWTSKADFPGDGRKHTAVFVIDGYAYAGGGKKQGGGTTNFKDFYRYNPTLNTWTQIADFPYPGEIYYMSYSNTAFVLNSKGYVAYGGIQLAKYTPKSCVGQGPVQ